MSEQRGKSWLMVGGCFMLYSCLVIGILLTTKIFYYNPSLFFVLSVGSFWIGWYIEYQLTNTNSGIKGSLTAPAFFGAAYMLPVIAGMVTRYVQWALWLSVLIYAILLFRVVWGVLSINYE